MNALAALVGAVVGLLLLRHWIGAATGASLGWLIASGVLPRLFGGFQTGHGDALMPAVFTLLGRLAKADGQVSQAEIDVCEALMDRLQLQPRARHAAVGAFNAGRRDDHDFSEAFATLRDARRHGSLFLNLFVDMALADGELHAEERRLLGKYAWMLGLRESALETLLLQRARGGTRGGGHADPYAELGLSPAASEQDIRRAFRRLVSEHHPDKMAARGAPPEAVHLAQQRTQAILAAYERIKSARGMK